MQTQVAANQPSNIRLAVASGKPPARPKSKNKTSQRKLTGPLRPSGAAMPVYAHDDEWMNYRAAARLIGSTSGTVMVWVSTGRYSVPHYKIGRSVRFKRSELLAWLQARKRGGVQ